MVGLAGRLSWLFDLWIIDRPSSQYQNNWDSCSLVALTFDLGFKLAFFWQRKAIAIQLCYYHGFNSTAKATTLGLASHRGTRVLVELIVLLP
jgi:hypothetical protein